MNLTDEPITHNEWLLLYGLLRDRQIDAEAQGIGQDHSSSVFRLKLLDKLARKMSEETR